MRRIIVTLALIVFLMVLDRVLNDFRFTNALFTALREFGRLFTRYISGA
ncbi:MAG: hypothetical protein WD036_09395 [Bauldia sp.]